MPEENTQLQVVSQCEHFLNDLSENDLRLLNRMVVERLKLFHKARELNSLAKFNLADFVSFVYRGKKISGVIIRLNRRSATVRTVDGKEWKVSPGFLTKARR